MAIRLLRGASLAIAGLAISGCLWIGQGAEADTLNSLTDASDMMIVGNLQAREAQQVDGLSHGIISGGQLVWGDALSFMMGADAEQQEVPILWIPGSGEPPAGEWLWFLGGLGPGPRQLLGWTAANRQSVILRQLQIQMVLVRLSGLTATGGPILEILIRNAYDRDIELPEFRLLKGQLQLHPKITLLIYAAGAAGAPEPLLLEPLPGRQVVLDPNDLIILLPGEEQRLFLDLEAVWGASARNAVQVYFEIEPYGASELDLSTGAESPE